MWKFILNLQFLFMPHYWIMNDEYSKELDEYMSNLIDSNNFKIISEYRALLGGVEIWIENRPYSCMMPYNMKTHGVRASRLTIKKGLDKLMHVFRQYLNEEKKRRKENLIKELKSL